MLAIVAGSGLVGIGMILRTVRLPDTERQRTSSRSRVGYVPVPRDARGVELACRRCHQRPRVSRRRLYELAEEAVLADGGESRVYLYGQSAYI